MKNSPKTYFSGDRILSPNSLLPLHKEIHPQTAIFNENMKGIISVYFPEKTEPETVYRLMKILQKEAKILDLKLRGPYYTDERRTVVYYEDPEIKTFIYVENYKEKLDPEKIRSTIRVLSLIAMQKEEEIYIENI
jgi:hypothetical protein